LFRSQPVNELLAGRSGVLLDRLVEVTLEVVLGPDIVGEVVRPRAGLLLGHPRMVERVGDDT
jgi:hypothetical protein